MKNFLSLLILIFTVSCNQQTNTVPVKSNPSPETASFDASLSAESVLDAFKSKGLPVIDEVIYTEETDGNKLLGRPNQYIGKFVFNDKRTKDKSLGQNNTVEVFKSEEDLINRKKYVEAVSKGFSPLAQYFFVHKNALLRLEHQLTPTQAKEYEDVLRQL